MRTEGEPPGPTVSVTELRTCISRMHFLSLCPMVLLRNYCTCVLWNAFPQPLSDGSVTELLSVCTTECISPAFV